LSEHLSTHPVALPIWFEEDSIIDDVYARSEDACCIFDDGVEVDGVEVGWSDIVWRECQIPVSAFGFPLASLDDHLGSLRNTTAEEQRQRGRGIADWVDGAGGIEQALATSPLLVTLRAGVLQIEDGYHRLGVAVFVHGATTVRALCSDMSLRPRLAASLSM
jgi:hypothetical protein